MNYILVLTKNPLTVGEGDPIAVRAVCRTEGGARRVGIDAAILGVRAGGKIVQRFVECDLHCPDGRVERIWPVERPEVEL